MTRLNNGIWIAFGTLSLFCMSYLGAYQVITSSHLNNMRSKLKAEIKHRKHLYKQSRHLKKACSAHSQEESFLRLRIAELDSQNEAMYQESINAKELVTFYETVTRIGAQNNVKTTSMESETIQLKGAAILNLNLSMEGSIHNLMIWLKDLETQDYPMVLNHYSISNIKSEENTISTMIIQLSLLVSE